jgi:serine protease Do
MPLRTGTALFFGMVLLLSNLAQAQAVVDESRRNAIVRAIENVAPAVVSINVLQVERERRIAIPYREFFGLFDFPRTRHSSRPRYSVRRVESAGTGFIFDHRGYVLTNYHVIEDAEGVASVTLPDGRELNAEVVGMDPRTDLVVLRAKGDNLPHVTLGESEHLLTGEWAIAIGNPFGTLISDPQPTVSVGVVSANHRRISPSVGEGERLYQDMIQTDAAINPGNSGGPLVNAVGTAIGVNTMIFSPTGGSIGLGFAIPIDRAKRVAAELIEHKRRLDPWPGIRVESVEEFYPEYLRDHGVSAESGSLVLDILKDSPAYKAGLRVGDVVQRVDEKPVRNATDMDFALWGLFVGDDTVFHGMRGDKEIDIAFRIRELKR